MPRISPRRLLAAGVPLLVVVVVVVVWTMATRETSDSAVAPSTVAQVDVDDSVTDPTTTLAMVRGTTTTTSTTTSTSLAPSTTSSATTTTIDRDRFATITEGDLGVDVERLQRMLNNITGTNLDLDGYYGPETARAVRNFQIIVDIPATGVANHDTLELLTFADGGDTLGVPFTPELPSEVPEPSVPDTTTPPATTVPPVTTEPLGIDALPIGAGGCRVSIVGDSLIASAVELHTSTMLAAGCAALVDALGSRSLMFGNPSGLDVLRDWRDEGVLGDVVVVALGTNDASQDDEVTWIRTWTEVMGITGGRPVVFLTASGQPGGAWEAAEERYSASLRRWCEVHPRCHLADWALTSAATDPASYVDHVHLTQAATEVRAAFIRDAVTQLVD